MKIIYSVKIAIILLIVLSSCSILNKSNTSKNDFKNSTKFEYTKIITYSDQLSTAEVSGIIYLHDHHLLIKGHQGFTFDSRFNLISKTNHNGKTIKSWRARPYQSEGRVYIEYREDSYLLIRFTKKNKAYLYTNN